MLEDHAGDVLRKAMMGRGLSPSELATRAGVSAATLDDFLEGGFDEDAARAMARVLDLDEVAFLSLPDYAPKPVAVQGVQRIDLPFGCLRVNAWLIVKGDTRILVDTGEDGPSLRFGLSEMHPGKPTSVLITHGHRDHIGGLHYLLDEKIPAMGWNIDGADPLGPNENREMCGISFRTVDLSGHYTPALGFLVEGLAKPVLAVGDAIFAGSMGGCKTTESYQIALERIREVCSVLEDDTILLPGHGPATTLGEERRSNPFLAGRV